MMSKMNYQLLTHLDKMPVLGRKGVGIERFQSLPLPAIHDP